MKNSSEPAIIVENVSKCYHIFERPQDRLLQSLYFGRRTFYREFWALKNINLTVRRGEVVGIIGRNGSGKSTLLQIVCGTLSPTTGKVSASGRVAGLLELGAGFNPEFTGRENVYMSAALLGLSTAQINDRFDEIAAFADIGEFLDQPLKFYSSGMMVRLGFAVQTVLEPSVLVVDEALAVGDARFQRKCYAFIEAFRDRGGTILFVTHDTSIIVQICNRAMILEQGQVFDEGEPHRIAKVYHRLMFGSQEDNSVQVIEQTRGAQIQEAVPSQDGGPSGDQMTGAVVSELPDAESFEAQGRREVRYGSKGIVVKRIGIRGSSGSGTLLFDVHESCEVFFEAEYREDIQGEVSFGFIISNIKGLEVFGTKCGLFDIFVPPGPKGKKFRGTMRLNMSMVPGTYFLSVAVAPRVGVNGDDFYDFRFDALEFQVMGSPRCFTTSVVDLKASLEYTEIEGDSGGVASVAN